VRKTVKAWVMLSKARRAVIDVFRYRQDREALGHDVQVRGVVTYDDGRPAPRKRTKGGRRG
jgi:hypothetical protein